MAGSSRASLIVGALLILLGLFFLVGLFLDVGRYLWPLFVIAVGARPYHQPDVDFSHPLIVDSDTVLSLQVNPRSITIYGAGVIGCEYASIFRGLRLKVNLINTRDRLLSFLDDEIVDALSYHLRENGVLIRHNEEYEKVVADASGVTLYRVKSGKVDDGAFLPLD